MDEPAAESRLRHGLGGLSRDRFPSGLTDALPVELEACLRLLSKVRGLSRTASGSRHERLMAWANEMEIQDWHRVFQASKCFCHGPIGRVIVAADKPGAFFPSKACTASHWRGWS